MKPVNIAWAALAFFAADSRSPAVRGNSDEPTVRSVSRAVRCHKPRGYTSRDMGAVFHCARGCGAPRGAPPMERRDFIELLVIETAA